jgi:putative thioredoxin
VSSFNGGYDLSSLRKPASPVAAAAPASVQVEALVIECTEQNLRDVLTISNDVPVVIEFHADSVKVLDFSARLKSLIEARNGSMVLARVDAQTEQRVSQAFGVKGAPTLIAVLKGQPVPLFEGDQDDTAVNNVLDQVLKVASENGVDKTAVADGVPAAAATVSDLPPVHQEAFDAIGRLDYDGAIAAYTKALNENPRDELAISGMAQVKLLKRTDGKNPNDLPASAPQGIDELLEWADVMSSVGNAKAAFDALLDAFAAQPEHRDAVRKHLIELFATVDPGDEVLIAARKRLATLLY